jgi:hypothetical protein
MSSIIPRFAIIALLASSFAACTALDVRTELEELPTRDESVAWLNNYFKEKNKKLVVSKDLLRAPRRGAPPYRCIVEHTAAGFMNVNCSGTSGGIISTGRSSGTFTELVRWSTSSEAEAIQVIEHLIVLGVKYNKIERLIAQECFRSNKDCPPGYP